jgi:hypothetical protein
MLRRGVETPRLSYSLFAYWQTLEVAILVAFEILDPALNKLSELSLEAEVQTDDAAMFLSPFLQR